MLLRGLEGEGPSAPPGVRALRSPWCEGPLLPLVCDEEGEGPPLPLV